MRKKCVPAGQEQGQGKRQARGQGKGPMGKPTKEQDEEDVVAKAQLPYDHPKKKTILKEPPVVAKGEIPMKKVKETLSKVNEYYSLKEADELIEEMCGKKHVEEIENDIEHVPEEDPEKHMDNVTKDIAETKKLVGNALIEFLLGENEYKEYFKSMLKKWGVNSPAQLDPAKRKEFFNAVEMGWKGEKGD